ncbi:MAG TPA: ABC transporter permease [Terriglobia bacterium]|nr:ABC transporter permease [Terriglobia bacterium]
MRPPRWLYTIPLRLRSLFQRRRVEQDLDDEIRYHLERQIQKNIDDGLTSEEARYAALRAMGSVEQRKEECRDVRKVHFIEDVLRDLHYAFRMMRRNPGFTLLTVLIMGLGIGANTAVFSVVDAVLLKPLSFYQPERLVMVWEENTRLGYPHADVATGNYLDWKEQSDAFEDLAGYFGNAFNLTGEGIPERLDGIQATPNLFSLLGVQPALGRWFNSSEGLPGQSQVAILSYGLWRRRFGGNPQVVGQSILINDQPHVVVGVMPEGFQFPRGDTQLWIPIQFPRTQSDAAERNVHFLRVVGRLKPLIGWQQAESQVQTIARRLAETYPVTNRNYGALVIPLQQEFVGDARLSLWLLLAASVLVLAIACSNVANLLVTRGIGRTREIAIRSALGAGRHRVARQLLVEGVFLSATACAVGVLFAVGSFQFLDKLIPPALSGSVSPALDMRLLGFAVLVTLFSGIAFGLAPFRGTFRIDLSEAFRARNAGSAGRVRSRAFLVAFETALAVVVVASTGLVVRTMMNIRAVDPGFRPQNVLTLRLELAATQYPTVEKRSAFHQEVLDRVHALPGVISAGFTTFLPYTNFAGTTGFFVEGRRDIPPTVVYRRETSSEYLSAIGVPLLKGRWFTEEDDRNHPPVAIISEGAARLLDGDPIGRHVNLGNPGGPWLTVVGVVGDMREEGVELPSRRAAAYTPYAQSQEVWFFNPRDLAIRVQADPMSLAAAVQREVWAINPNQTVSQIRTLETILEQQVSNRELQAALLSAFSLLSISLAALGLYALLSFVVEARKQEFGVRIALGATPRELIASVLHQSVLWIGNGALAGLAITLVVARSLSSLLYGVEPTDPLTLAASVLLLFGVGMLAALVPAWRASRIDPMVALRHE